MRKKEIKARVIKMKTDDIHKASVRICKRLNQKPKMKANTVTDTALVGVGIQGLLSHGQTVASLLDHLVWVVGRTLLARIQFLRAEAVNPRVPDHLREIAVKEASFRVAEYHSLLHSMAEYRAMFEAGAGPATTTSAEPPVDAEVVPFPGDKKKQSIH